MKFDQAHRYGQLRQPLYANNRTNCAVIQPVYMRQKRGLIEIHYRLSLRSSPDWSIVIQSEVGSSCGVPLPPHVSPHMEGCPHVPPHMARGFPHVVACGMMSTHR